MVNKKTFIVFLLFGVILLSGSVAAAANDVAYVYKRAFKIDANIFDIFEGKGLDVELIHIDDVGDLSGYGLVFVGDENYRKDIMVEKYNTVLITRHDGDDYGLTDNDGISQLGSTKPLSVMNNDDEIVVYTSAFVRNRLAVPYYYLDIENKGVAFTQVASTMETSSGKRFGDVISYAGAGSKLANRKTAQGNICFFGIVASDFWTDAAREMFMDCVDFALGGQAPVPDPIAECEEDIDCGIDMREFYCDGNSIFERATMHSCEIIGEAMCIMNVTEVELEFCSFGCLEGACMEEPVEIECQQDSDCGIDESELYCDGDYVFERSTVHSCEINGEAMCMINVTEVELEFCSFGCLEGACLDEPVKIECFSNDDCPVDFISDLFCQVGTVVEDENVYYILTDYMCENPGTEQSRCVFEEIEVLVEDCSFGCFEGMCMDEPLNIECFSDSDCPEDTESVLYCAIGTDYQDDNLYKLVTDYMCENPGTEQSRCVSQDNEVLVQDCSIGCLDAMCVEEGQGGIHDVGFIDFTNSVEMIRLEEQDGTDILGNELMCYKKYKIGVTVENFGDFTEDVSFAGNVDGLDVQHNPILGQNPGSDNRRTKTVNFTLGRGWYNISVEAIIDGFSDDNPGDNFVKREVFVSCNID